MGFKHPVILCLFLAVICGATLTRAADFDPRRVILLPKSDNGGPRTLDDIKKQQEESKKNKNSTQPNAGRVQNDNITIIPRNNEPTTGTVVIPNARNAGEGELTKNEQALNQAYAKHLYSSICSQNYRDELAPRSEKNLDMKRMWADIQKTCRCMSDEILAKVPAADVSDYVMFTHGWQSPTGKEDAELLKYDESGRSEPVSVIASNPQIRKKCGFLN